jgi:hypothetical protein
MEEIQPVDILDTKTKSMIKLSSFAGFGAKKINKIIVDGLGASLDEQAAKFGCPVVVIMGESQCKTNSFVVFEFDSPNMEVSRPLEQISIVEMMQKSDDVRTLFA